MRTPVATTLSFVLLLVLTGCGDRTNGPKTAETKTPAAGQTSAGAPTPEVPREQSLPSQWASKAKRVELGSGGEVLGHVEQGKSKVPVIRVGTLHSWAGEDQDQFATRAARMMRTMSQMTPYTFCGHLCRAPGTQAGPMSIDILTQKDAKVCAAIPVCSLPNGSGITSYGTPIGEILLINADPRKLSSTNQAGRPVYDATQFVFTTTQGQMVKPSDNVKKPAHYVMATRDILQRQQPGSLPRTVYDFAPEKRALLMQKAPNTDAAKRSDKSIESTPGVTTKAAAKSAKGDTAPAAKAPKTNTP